MDRYLNAQRVRDRVVFYKERIHEIRLDFRENLKPRFEGYVRMPLTQAIRNDIQSNIDTFLFKWDLDINVYVDQTEDGLVLMGVGLIDSIVWESIQ